jgi:hypothetical protein
VVRRLLPPIDGRYAVGEPALLVLAVLAMRHSWSWPRRSCPRGTAACRTGGLGPGIGEQTVKTHVRSILTKLGLQDRVQAAIFALRH